MCSHVSAVEGRIRELANRHGLGVLKRITTGGAQSHFATFELCGEMPAVRGAWPEVEAGFEMASVQHGNNPDHPGYCKPFIVIESVWCD